MTNLLSRRFQELIDQFEGVLATRRMEANPLGGSPYTQVDAAVLLQWIVKASSLLSQACGSDSVHLQQFTSHSRTFVGDSFSKARMLIAILSAAQEDYDGGYLASVRGLVQAEVFGSELEQAHELLRSGYATAAAVIAGTVLETTIRSMCDAYNVAHGKLNRMNEDLTKAGAYNSLQQKAVATMAAIRNAAAHGQTSEYTPAQVDGMLSDVERFVLQYTAR